jgi:hypothetical protein
VQNVAKYYGKTTYAETVPVDNRPDRADFDSDYLPHHLRVFRFNTLLAYRAGKKISDP